MLKAIIRGVLVLAILAVFQAHGAQASKAATPPSFSFGAAGDYGASNNVTSTLTAMSRSNLSFALALGDLDYDQLTPETAWCQYVHQSIGSLPFELVSGNHEDGGDVAQGLIGNYAACMPNQMSGSVGTYGEQYYFDYPASSPLARVIMISPGLNFSDGDVYNYSQGGADYNWVSNAIDSARAAGIQWIIVGMHKVCLSTGDSACDVGTDILNLLVSKHVDLILDGHDHSYQRSKQLALNGTSCTGITPATYNPGCVVDGGNSGAYTEGKGTIIVTAGTGGIDDEYGAIYSMPDSPYFAAVSGNNLNPQKGFVKYTVSASGIAAQFVPSTNTSNFTDSFSISPSGQPVSGTPNQDVIMSTGFDAQSPGALQTGSGSSEFSGVNGGASASVVNTVADSTPNALALTLKPNGGSYAVEQYPGSGYMAHSLDFNVELGSDLNLPANDYMVLAQTQAEGATSADGKVDVVVGGGSDDVFLDYVDSTGVQHYLYSGTSLTPGSWHSVDLLEAVGTGNGYLGLYIDGHPVATQSAIDTGSQPIGTVGVGDEYAPNDAALSGHVYIDDVYTLSDMGFPPIVPPPPSGTAPIALDTINFDNQAPGPLSVGSSRNEFGGETGNASLAVENSVASSAPNALSASVVGGASSYAYEQYPGPGYASHTLQLAVQLGPDFTLPSNDYMTLAQTLPVSSGVSDIGKVSLIMTGGGNNIHLDYVDSSDVQHSLYPSTELATGVWHTIAISEMVGIGTGILSLTVDGKIVAAVGGIDLGGQPVDYYAVGDLWSPSDPAIAGHVFFDDVATTTAAPAPVPVTPTPTPVTPTPVTPTPTPVTPTPTPITPTPTPITPSPTPVTPTPTPVTPTPTPVTPTPTPVTPTPTPTSGPGLFTQNFDALPLGAMVPGTSQNSFSAIEGGGRFTIESGVASTTPNALSLTLGSNSDVLKTYPATVSSNTIGFSFEVARGSSLPASSYYVLAQTRTTSGSGTGDAEILATGAGQLYLLYVTSGSKAHIVSGGATVTAGAWHSIQLSESTSAGLVSMTVDGRVVATASKLSLSANPISGFALGEMNQSRVSGRTGTIYFDNVSATTP